MLREINLTNNQTQREINHLFEETTSSYSFLSNIIKKQQIEIK
jgi:hypothetical protein